MHDIREPEWNIRDRPALGGIINPHRHGTDRQPDSALAGISRMTAESYPARFALSPGARSRRQRVGTIVSATEAAACSAIRDGAINRIGRSTHPGQQRTDLPRRDPHPELLRHASSQFIIGQNLAEETN